jgi:hypothetical protein
VAERLLDVWKCKCFGKKAWMKGAHEISVGDQPFRLLGDILNSIEPPQMGEVFRTGTVTFIVTWTELARISYYAYQSGRNGTKHAAHFRRPMYLQFSLVSEAPSARPLSDRRMHGAVRLPVGSAGCPRRPSDSRLATADYLYRIIAWAFQVLKVKVPFMSRHTGCLAWQGWRIISPMQHF